MLSFGLFTDFSVIKYRPQKIVMPARPGDLPACPPKWTKVKGKCAGVPSIYILQPDGMSMSIMTMAMPGPGEVKDPTSPHWNV